MWSLLSRRHQLSIIVVATLLTAWAIDAIYTLAGGRTPSMIKIASLVVTIVGTVLVAIFNGTWRWLWRRFPAIQRKTFPDMNGTWQGTLVSTWIDPETGQPKPPILTTITIRQGLLSTSVSLRTGESTSHSTRALLETFPETSRFRIWYSYNNDPQAQYQHRSSPHEGVAFLELDADANMNRLTGRYYTARRTTGDMDVVRHAE
ncbi:hypothetical protein [Burkholderia pseudomallei]|uniref:Cap15 family cyclic dinucleotide receptor domain-containing protein n=1 Tax=Burkholderia pseudomallei TaxID=28450 RepID=UPI00135F0476|nr:hypothetical protein [Burkholderia pseudomallei]MWA35489.1 hypothetical protein [Burkholderia pseudomallei]